MNVKFYCARITDMDGLKLPVFFSFTGLIRPSVPGTDPIWNALIEDFSPYAYGCRVRTGGKLAYEKLSGEVKKNYTGEHRELTEVLKAQVPGYKVHGNLDDSQIMDIGLNNDEYTIKAVIRLYGPELPITVKKLPYVRRVSYKNDEQHIIFTPKRVLKGVPGVGNEDSQAETMRKYLFE